MFFVISKHILLKLSPVLGELFCNGQTDKEVLEVMTTFARWMHFGSTQRWHCVWYWWHHIAFCFHTYTLCLHINNYLCLYCLHTVYICYLGFVVCLHMVCIEFSHCLYMLSWFCSLFTYGVYWVYNDLHILSRFYVLFTYHGLYWVYTLFTYFSIV